MDYRKLFDDVHKRPGLFGLDGTFHNFTAFVGGCDAGNDRQLLAGFRESLVARFGGGNNLTWEGLVLRLAFPEVSHGPRRQELNTDPELNAVAVTALFGALDEFLRQRDESDALYELATAASTPPDVVEESLLTLLAQDPPRGAGAAWDRIAGRPEVKPSRALLIDPGNGAEFRWWQAVHGGVALLRSETLGVRLDEALEAVAESDEFARDVLARLPLDGVGRCLSPDHLARFYVWAGSRSADLAEHLSRELASRERATAVEALTRVAADVDEPRLRASLAKLIASLTSP